MIYLLEFLGLLGIAVALAASPFLVRLLESVVAADFAARPSATGHGLANTISRERAEMREEIRRATVLLESDRRRPSALGRNAQT